ncbi:14430_t:CDS:10, partial [Acaulospora morrowiae]
NARSDLAPSEEFIIGGSYIMSSSTLRERHKENSTPSSGISKNVDRSHHVAEEFVNLSTSDDDKGRYPNSLILCFLMTFRILDALVTRTYFNPDEYWQSVEQIRGAAHPMIFAVLYKCLEVIGVDSTDLFIYSPRILQAIIAAIGDFYTYRLAQKFFGDSTAKWTLFCSVVSWFNFFCSIRMLSNGVEMVLTVAALHYWPWPSLATLKNWENRKKDLRLSLCLFAASCILRPTNVIIWSFLYVQLLLETLQSISLFYGVHPWHWYLTQGLPVILTSLISFIIFGIQSSMKKPHDWQHVKSLLQLIGWVVAVYSLLGHKEFRFMYPLLPIFILIAGYGFQKIHDNVKSGSDEARTRSRKYLKLSVSFFLLTNIPMAYYASIVHQSGVIEVMNYLRKEVDNGGVKDIGFLMPCHSTPFYSNLHRRIDMWFLTCEPPLGLQDVNKYMDEADQFYANPLEFLTNHFEPSVTLSSSVHPNSTLRKWPSHLVVFEALMDDIGSTLSASDYTQKGGPQRLSQKTCLQIISLLGKIMDPENFVDLLLDRIEANATFPRHYSYFHLYLKPLTKSSNVTTSNLPSGPFNSYYDVLFAYICSDLIAPSSELTFNGIFLTHLLIKRLRNSINPKSYTSILRFFNTFTSEPHIYPFRPCITMLIVQVLNPGRVPGHTIHWILSFIRDEATWLLQEVDQETVSSQAFTSENISSFLSEQFGKLSRTLMYDDLELSRFIEGFSKVTNIKVKISLTDEEVIANLKFYGFWNILEYSIHHPSEHRYLQSELLEPEDFVKFQSLRVLFKIYRFEHPDQIEPLTNQMRISRLITRKEIDSMTMDTYLAQLMHDQIVDIHLDHLEVSKLELEQCLKIKQDFEYDNEFWMNTLDTCTSDMRLSFEKFSALENEEIILKLVEVAELVTNVPLRKAHIRQFHQLNVTLTTSTKLINHKDINRLFLDIWLTAFSRLFTTIPHSTSSKTSNDNLLSLATVFLCAFCASMQFTWLPPVKNLSKPPALVFAPFLEGLYKIYHGLMLDEEFENEVIEYVFGTIFDKLGLELPLEVLIRESGDLEKIITRCTLMSILEERLRNINCYDHEK